MKNIYLLLVVILGIGASIFVYMSTQGSTEESINTLSKTSSKFAKSINACKNARIEIDGKVFQLKNEVAEISASDIDSGSLKLQYNKHAVRGYMDGGASNDMVCTYDLFDGTKVVKTYAAVLIGLSVDSFAPLGVALLGENITVSDMKIEGGKAIINIIDNETGKISTKTTYLEGDVLNVF